MPGPKRLDFPEAERNTSNEDGSTTVRLHYPITDGKATVDRLTVKRPKAKDLRKMDEAKGNVGKELRLMEALTNVTVNDLGELEAEDFANVDEVINSYMGKRQPTGETSSET